MARLTPTAFVANEAARLAVESDTLSPLTIPDRTAFVLLMSTVALADASYTLSLAVSPVIVRVLAVMSALVIGWVR